ncbi:MAG: hypothetical protein ABSA16_09765 [Thermoguttaceae bacterium]|jgi:hypothetical protein
MPQGFVSVVRDLALTPILSCRSQKAKRKKQTNPTGISWTNLKVVLPSLSKTVLKAVPQMLSAPLYALPLPRVLQGKKKMPKRKTFQCGGIIGGCRNLDNIYTGIRD